MTDQPDDVSAEHLFDDPHDDPHQGPDHLSGPTVGGSVVFDSSGGLHEFGLTVPGTGEGSDQATITLGGGDHPDLTVPPGLDFSQPSHVDPTSYAHMPEPYQPDFGPPEAGPPEEPGDYPQPDYPQPDMGDGTA